MVVSRFALLSASVLASASCSSQDAPDGGVAMDAAAEMDAAVPDVSMAFDLAPRDVPLLDSRSDACASVVVDTHRTPPNVMVIIDRSGSMSQPFSGEATRWEALHTALTSMPDGLAYQLRDTVRFGAVMYSEEPETPGCPELGTATARLDGYIAIDFEYMRNVPGGNTPTGDAVMATLDRLTTLVPDTGPIHLVLATDGEPATCADGTDVMGGRALVIEQVTAAFERGIRTHVLSVGTEIANTHLQEVANAGAGHEPGEPDSPFWVATDYTTLRDSLSEIVGGVISCEIELEGMIDPAFACEGTVTLDGDILACRTDWRPIDSSHIELIGPACARLRDESAEETLVASFPCDVFI